MSDCYAGILLSPYISDGSYTQIKVELVALSADNLGAVSAKIKPIKVRD